MMHRNEEFLLRQVAGMTVILPVGKASETFPGMISVNETGAFLWELLKTEQTLSTLTAAMTESYQVEAEQAEADIRAFLERLAAAGAVMGWA